MLTYLTIGSSPWGETCAQVGRPNYEEQAHAECKAYKNQLLRFAVAAGKAPVDGFKLIVKAHEHDFGTYYDVGAQFDETNEAAGDLAYFLEGSGPEWWDEEALKELGLP